MINQKFNWHNYNQSQTQEKILFMRLLRELCNLIANPKHQKGRKPVDTSDLIYSLALKTYLTHSSRRACGDLRLATKAGFVEKPFHFNTLLKYLENPCLKPLLLELIEISSLPLKQVEIDFAVDATGFSTSVYDSWFNMRSRKDSSMNKFRKCHAICGVSTNIITSVEITNGHAHDNPYFGKLIENTSKNFKIAEVSADKAYSSKSSLESASKIGAIAYIPFKSNVTGKSRGSILWKQMFEYFSENKEEFYKQYHKRSNIESCFSMIKKRFGHYVRCRKTVSQDNEILLKVLCHNICILIQEIFLNQIEVDFGKSAKTYFAHN